MRGGRIEMESESERVRERERESADAIKSIWYIHPAQAAVCVEGVHAAAILCGPSTTSYACPVGASAD